jgi:uncharacterized protein (DUF433 family)
MTGGFPLQIQGVIFSSGKEREMQDEIVNFGRITIDPALCNGKPTIRGKRITVQTILEFLGAGDSREEILHQYPSLEPEDIDACLDFAARLMSHRYVLQKTA